MAPLKREDSADSLLNNGPRSEYIKRYPEHPIQRTRPFKPDNTPVRGDAPVDSETVFKRDYPEHPVQPRQRARPADGNLKSEGQLDFTSQYSQEFSPRAVERRKPFKPEHIRDDLGAFDAHPSYRDDYPEWKLPQKFARHREEWNPPDRPFQGQSINSTDFPEHQISPRQNYRPDNRPLQSETPFDAHTDYADTFKEHPLPPKLSRAKLEWTKPTQPLEGLTDYRSRFTEHKLTPRQQPQRAVYESPTVAMDTRTTVGESYQGPVQPMRESYRPDRQPLMSDVPFEDSTTSHQDFRAHEVHPRKIRAREEYQRPAGEMDLVSSHTAHYTSHEAHKRDAIAKPGSSGLLRGEGDMLTRTTHQNDFVERPLAKRDNLKPEPAYLGPAGPMESETTQRADFTQRQPAVPTRSFRPSHVPVTSDVPLDDRTGYRDNFVPHKVSPRQIRPRTPHKPPSAQFEARTTVKESYLGHVQPKRDSFRPDRQPVMSDAPFEGSTTMNHDFKAYEVRPREQHMRESYQRPEGEMDLTTTHTANFVPHHASRHYASERPGSSGLLRGHGPMQASTNHQSEYRQPPPVTRTLVRPKREYVPPQDPMSSITTQGTSFLDHGPQPRFTYKPHSEYVKPDVPVENRTGYQDSFQQHAVQPRQMRNREVHEPPKAPLETATTTSTSYVGSVMPKRESFRPNRDYFRSDLPLEGETTANASFKAWPTMQRERHKQSEYVKPDGFMDLTTSNRESYKEVRGERPVAARLNSSNLLQGQGAMDTNTSYGSEFMPKSLADRKLVKPDNKYVPSGVPFGGQSEYRAAHVGYIAPRERSMKPIIYSDTLNQRDDDNPFRIRDNDWRQMLKMADAKA